MGSNPWDLNILGPTTKRGRKKQPPTLLGAINNPGLQSLWSTGPQQSLSKKGKRVPLRSSERLYIWEHPKMYGRICNICHQPILKMSDLELDHTKAYSKGGKCLALAHKECNRMKGNKSLRYVQKRMGFK